MPSSSTSRYAWRECGEVPGTEWFYDVTITPTHPDDRRPALGSDARRWTFPATDYLAAVRVCSHRTQRAHASRFTLDKLLNFFEDDQAVGITVEELLQILRIGLRGIEGVVAGVDAGDTEYAPVGISVEAWSVGRGEAGRGSGGVAADEILKPTQPPPPPPSPTSLTAEHALAVTVLNKKDNMRITLRLPPPPYLKRGAPTPSALAPLPVGSDQAVGTVRAASCSSRSCPPHLLHSSKKKRKKKHETPSNI